MPASTGPTRPLGPRTRISGGQVIVLMTLGCQCVEMDVTGSSPPIVCFPRAPFDGDVVWIKLVGAATVSPAQAYGLTFAIENPMQPGSYISPASVVGLGVNAGATFIFEFDSLNSRWDEIL